MAARTLPRPSDAFSLDNGLKPMPATAKLTALASIIMALGGLVYAWHRINAASTSPQKHVDEIFRPSPSDAVPCDFSAQPRPLMVLVLGQSNAGNHGSLAPQPDEMLKASFIFEGLCYRTSGAAPGATGRGRNIWTALGPRLSRTTGRPVVFSVLAVDATQINDWVSPGKIQHHLIETLVSHRNHSFFPDIVLWQQGEADAKIGTTSSEYREHFARLVALLHNQGITAPIIAALSTRCRNDGSEQVRTALKTVAAENPSVRLGPDTDTLTGLFRHDGCHFSRLGLDAAAELWEPPIMESLPSSVVANLDRPLVKPSNPRQTRQ